MKMHKNKSSLSSSVWAPKYVLAEIIFGFSFWSLFNEYVPTVWFFPLNKMDFTGNEAYLGCFLIVVVLGSHYIGSFFLRHSALLSAFAYIIGLLSFYPYNLDNPPFPFSFYPPEDPNAGRMFMLALSVIIAWMCVLQVWRSSNSQRRYRSLLGFLLGLLIMNIVRFEYLTINPVTTWTKPIFVNISAVLWAGTVLWLEGWPAEDRRMQRVGAPSPTAVGASLGAQLFLTHMLYASHGTIPRHIDLNPFLGGIVVILTVAAGIALSSRAHLIGERRLAALGGVGIGLFIIGEDGLGGPLSYLGLLGSVLLGLHVISLWPTVVCNWASTTKPGRALLVESLVYLLFIFWSVWVVAYKFIPWWLGSNLLRERNRTLIVAAFAAQAAAYVFRNANAYADSAADKKKEDDGGAVGDKRNRTTDAQDRLPRKEVYVWLVGILLAMFVPAMVHRFALTLPNAILTPTLGKPTRINAMIWNIHFGYDNFGRNNFEDVTAAVIERDINVLGLLESDLTRIITGGRDIVEYLEQSLGMYSDFGPNSAKSTWGCGMLSKFPIEKADHIILPSPEGELACLIDALIRVDGKLVNVLVTHFGNTEDKLDRQLQTEGMANIVRRQPNPVIVLSYITDRPGSKNYHELLSSGLVDTTNQQNRYCEYIFYRDLDLVSFDRWSGGTISDTEAQYATFTLKR